MVAMRARFWLGLALALAVIGADQLSKFWIVSITRLPEIGKIELSGVFDLTFVRNAGVSFGLLHADGQIERWGLVVMSGAIACAFVWWLRSAERHLSALALGLVIGGAVGNLIDRARFGYVVDFLDFSGMYFPWVFNVADASITIGAALLILDYLFAESSGQQAKPA